MPFNPDTWADGPAGETPITAAALTKLGTQYQAVVDDLPTLVPPAGAGEPVGVEGGFASPRLSARSLTAPSNVVLRAADPHFVVFSIESPVRLRSVSFQITAAGDAGCQIKLWLYRTGTHGSVPDTLHNDFGAVTGSALNSGVQLTPASPVPLAPGWYAFIIGHVGVTTTAPGVMGSNTILADHFPGRTGPHMTRLDLWTRAGNVIEGVSTAGNAPATLDLTSGGPIRVNNYSGGRVPFFLLDLIPA